MVKAKVIEKIEPKTAGFKGYYEKELELATFQRDEDLNKLQVVVIGISSVGERLSEMINEEMKKKDGNDEYIAELTSDMNVKHTELFKAQVAFNTAKAKYEALLKFLKGKIIEETNKLREIMSPKKKQDVKRKPSTTKKKS